MADQDNEVSSFIRPSANPPRATVTIVGPAYDSLQELRRELIDADTDKKVVMLALGLLELAKGKRIQIVDDDGRAQVVELWKQRT
jgi:hypothetical protein